MQSCATPIPGVSLPMPKLYPGARTIGYPRAISMFKRDIAAVDPRTRNGNWTAPAHAAQAAMNASVTL
jgi:hypothetical protein